MGWLWSGSSSTGEAAASTQNANTSSQPAAATSSTALPPSKVAAQVSDGATENDPELQKFVAIFQSSESGLGDAQKANATADDGTAAGSPTQTVAKTGRPLSSAGDVATREDRTVPVRERSLAEATLPVSMSCRQAFDLAWACQSPAGQWRAVYRHGGVRPCSDLWDDFWFCMRVKGYAEGPLKAEAVRSHYRKKEMDRYYLPGQPSSEDIWRSRTIDELLPPGAVFQQNFQVVGGDQPRPKESRDDGGREDAAQILADAERRQCIRQGMGYEK
ncbi:hypothetical protein SEPCBS119000_004342 [Sporothrix epigloea]|uniref:Early meiotic induction protein 1 n=1 Tax=Sporothrix epigloea TaxID=1892477 RepID=A0ABP0DRK5_9PEZI